MTLPETFFNPKQAQEKANHSSQKKPREKGKGKKKFKSQACLGQNVLNAILVARTVSCRVTNAFSTRLNLIWPRSSFKTTKMSKKKTILAKSSRCQWNLTLNSLLICYNYLIIVFCFVCQIFHGHQATLSCKLLFLI